MKAIPQLIYGALLFAFASNLCVGQIQVFSDEEIFLNNVGDFNLESFEANKTTTESTEPINTKNMTVSIASGVLSIVNQGSAGELPTDGVNTLLAELGPFVLHFELVRSTKILGLNINDFGDVGGTPGGSLTIATDDGSTFQIAFTPDSSLPNDNNIFFGLITNEPINNFEIRSTAGGNDGIFVDEIYLDRILLGDVNNDGVVDLLDVGAFVALITQQEFQAEADVNEDGVVDLLDVEPFIEILTN